MAVASLVEKVLSRFQALLWKSDLKLLEEQQALHIVANWKIT